MKEMHQTHSLPVILCFITSWHIQLPSHHDRYRSLFSVFINLMPNFSLRSSERGPIIVQGLVGRPGYISRLAVSYVPPVFVGI
jgi:hypothetical protein